MKSKINIIDVSFERSTINKDTVEKELNDVWHELNRIQKQRDNDLNVLQDTINQSQCKDNEYQKVLKDIKRLGQSLEEIENVMVKEVCQRSGYSVASFAELKGSMLNQNKIDNLGKL